MNAEAALTRLHTSSCWDIYQVVGKFIPKVSHRLGRWLFRGRLLPPSTMNGLNPIVRTHMMVRDGLHSSPLCSDLHEHSKILMCVILEHTHTHKSVFLNMFTSKSHWLTSYSVMSDWKHFLYSGSICPAHSCPWWHGYILKWTRDTFAVFVLYFHLHWGADVNCFPYWIV